MMAEGMFQGTDPEVANGLLDVFRKTGAAFMSAIEEMQARMATFTYESDFDENGLLYYIATGEGAGEPYTNPAEAGHIAVTRAADGPHSNSANVAAGRTDALTYTKSEPGGWYKFDLGPERRVVPTHYTLKHGLSYGQHRLRHWVLEGSNDDATWTVLKTHVDDHSLPDRAYGTASWPITGYTGGPVRYLRIRSTGRTSSGNDQVFVGGFEVYGTLHRE